MPFVQKPFSNIITFTRASTATYFDASGVLQSAANNAPRIDFDPATLLCNGLLIEEARTNSIPNSTGSGGSAGVAPTTWTASGNTSNGITVNVQGVGTENGINYVDLEIIGTATVTGTAFTYAFSGSIAVSAAQVWTYSFYTKLVSGSLTNLTLGSRVAWLGGFGSSDVSFVPTSANLAAQRALNTATAPASATTAAPQLRIATVNGVTYNCVIRIGLPQLELGAFATSVIPTTTTALTRAADVASVNTLSPWFNASEGAVYVSATLINTPTTATFGLYALSNGTIAERIYVNTGSGAGGNINTIVTDNSISQAQTINGGLSAAGIYNYANAYKVNDFASVANGGSAVTDNLGSLPNVDRLILGANAVGNAQFLNGYIRRITYYPRRLSNAELQALTS